jgi:hypothetical protein
VPVLTEAYSLNSLTFRMKKMEVKQKGDIESWGDLNVKLNSEYGEHSLNLTGYGYGSSDNELFRIKFSGEIEGHHYYMLAWGRLDLEVNRIYTLGRNEEHIRAHLEIDKIPTDQFADGTFRLTRNGPYPQGVFNFVEGGAFSAEGEFDYKQVRK